MRLLSKKAGYLTTMDVSERIASLEDVEGTIYRILSMSNKVHMSKAMGYSRQGFYNKIRDRSFTLGEIIKMFKMIRDFKEEDFRECRIDRIKRYRAMSLMDFNRMYVGRKKKRKNESENAAMRKMREDSPGEEQGSVSGV